MEEKVAYRVNKKVIATHYEYLHGEGNMFIQLANELWAIIPADALNEQPEMKEQIVRYFSEKGKSYSHQAA